MLKIKCDINQQYLKTDDLHFVRSEFFLLTWSCGSHQRDTISSGWKFRLNNLAAKGFNSSYKISGPLSTTGTISLLTWLLWSDIGWISVTSQTLYRYLNNEGQTCHNSQIYLPPSHPSTYSQGRLRIIKIPIWKKIWVGHNSWVSQLTRDADSIVFQCWACIASRGPTLKKHCVNVWCLLGRQH